MSSDIFISYAREDRARVQPIAEALAQRGFDVWWDKGLRSGEDYRDRIEEMLQTARCVVVAWSRDSLRSDFVLDEAGRGHRRKVLLPVFIDEGIEPPLGFGGIHTSDLSGWLRDPADPAFEQFAGDVAAVLGREPAPGPVPPAPAPPPAARRKPLPWAVAGGGALLLIAAAGYLAFSGPGRRDGAGSVAQADSTSLVAHPAPPACATLSLSGVHPLDQARRSLTRARYSVDTATHLLLDQQGAPVPGGGASSYGTLTDRRFIVVHYSAASPGVAERYFQQPEVQSSTHVMIDRDGSVRQMLQFNAAAQHAGESEWRGVRGLNTHSIGIDLENWGRLALREGRWYPADGRQAVPADEVQLLAGPDGKQQGWHKFSDAQLDAFLQVSCALRHAYPGIGDVVGHDSVSPGRRQDPGPAFPVAELRATLFPPRSTAIAPEE
jgi:hypothetical protein